MCILRMPGAAYCTVLVKHWVCLRMFPCFFAVPASSFFFFPSFGNTPRTRLPPPYLACRVAIATYPRGSFYTATAYYADGFGIAKGPLFSTLHDLHFFPHFANGNHLCVQELNIFCSVAVTSPLFSLVRCLADCGDKLAGFSDVTMKSRELGCYTCPADKE